MPTTADQLQQLAALRKEGVLTDEEFEEQKRIVLAESRARAASNPATLTEVGAYRLMGMVGQGGMGAVYRGRHRTESIAERQGGDVAVKVMRSEYARNTEYQGRFEREASLGLKLDHPGIVKVHDLVVDGGSLALVMDLVEGRPLTEFIGEAVGPIPWDRAWPQFEKLLDAVGHAHERGVVHRDLKPDNILISATGEPQVIDFGIAKDLDASRTRTGTGMGTIEYMAPEQYTEAKDVDRRADIYSLGMILYEMLAGRLPWDADAPQFRILELKANRQLPSPSVFCADLPAKFVAALAPALSADPNERPPSIPAFVARLAAASAAVAASVPDRDDGRHETDRAVRDLNQDRPKDAAPGRRLVYGVGACVLVVGLVMLALGVPQLFRSDAASPELPETPRAGEDAGGGAATSEGAESRSTPELLPPEPATPGNEIEGFADLEGLSALLDTNLAITIEREVPGQHNVWITATAQRILVWFLDRERDLRAGDELRLLYEPVMGYRVRIAALRYVSQKKGAEHRAYYYQREDDRFGSYWDDTGREIAPRLRDTPIEDYEQITAVLGDGRGHSGWDFRAPVGTPVLASRDAVVLRTTWNFKYNGNCLELRNGDGTIARYLHLEQVDPGVTVGTRVRAGQVVGSSGYTGRTSTPHLHYELESSGRIVDPASYHGTRHRELDGADLTEFLSHVSAYDEALLRL